MDSDAASGGAAGSGTTLLRTTSGGKPDKDYNRQLVIDVSRMEEGAAEKVATTEVAKQTITQGIRDVERLAGDIPCTVEIARRVVAQAQPIKPLVYGRSEILPQSQLVEVLMFLRSRARVTSARLTTVQGIPNDFRVWRASDSTSVIKFLVDKDKEAAFR